MMSRNLKLNEMRENEILLLRFEKLQGFCTTQVIRHDSKYIFDMFMSFAALMEPLLLVTYSYQVPYDKNPAVSNLQDAIENLDSKVSLKSRGGAWKRGAGVEVVKLWVKGLADELISILRPSASSIQFFYFETRF